MSSLSSVSFSYDNAKNRTDVNTPDNTNRNYTYNAANRITGVTNTTSSGTQSFSYTHDSNGNILSENTTNYSYDSLNRLSSWFNPSTSTTIFIALDRCFAPALHYALNLNILGLESKGEPNFLV